MLTNEVESARGFGLFKIIFLIICKYNAALRNSLAIPIDAKRLMRCGVRLTVEPFMRSLLLATHEFVVLTNYFSFNELSQNTLLRLIPDTQSPNRSAKRNRTSSPATAAACTASSTRAASSGPARCVVTLRNLWNF